MVREDTDKKTNDLNSSHLVARALERHVRIDEQREAKVGDRQAEAPQYQQIAWYLLH